MTNAKSLARKSGLFFAAALVSLFFPSLSYADGAESAGTATSPTQSATTGLQQPTGADGNTFHYNATTGLWENDYYTWDPTTKQTTPKATTYTYNPNTGKWDTNTWRYDAQTGRYYEVKPTSATPQPSVTQEPTVSSSAPDKMSNSPTSSTSASTITNAVSSTAISGNAVVANNTLAGNAQSGNATVTSNTINMLQSSITLNGALPQTFTMDITKDSRGDLVLDPSLFLVQPASASCCGISTTLNVNNQDQIHNTISLNATSGNATVSGNTQAGNATTGSANAVANVINLANSSIGSASSFLGVINIYSNLDGDILLPPEALQVLASNAPTTTIDTSTIENGSLLSSFTDKQTISNNISTTAISGAASVDNNTQAGGATSGKAATNVTVLNLTGRQVVAANSLLVFVNVLGHWIGLILNEPTGTTAAALSGDTTSACACRDQNIDATGDTAITNNVDVNAASGDATVTHNTTAGNATSGDASASVNLLNITDSNLSLSNWFGILFINVFGSWTGSFGKDTAAGNPVTTGGPEPNNGETPTLNTPNTISSASNVFRLTSTANGGYRVAAVEPSTISQVAGISTTDSNNNIPKMIITAKNSHESTNWQFVTAGLLLSCCLLGVERVQAIRQRKSSAL